MKRIESGEYRLLDDVGGFDLVLRAVVSRHHLDEMKREAEPKQEQPRLDAPTTPPPRRDTDPSGPPEFEP